MRIKHTVLALALAATFGAASAAEPAKDSSAAAAKAAKDASAELERARAEFKDAEAKMRESARRLAELSAKAGGDAKRHAYAYRYFTEPRRAMIGIVIGDDEAQGAYIAGVTPGAPAARAGVKAGDKLVAVNGKPVPAGAQADGKVARAARGEDGTRVAREMIGELEAGQKVKLTVERAGKRIDFDLAAEQREASDLPMWVGEFDHDIDVDVDVHIDPAQIERDVRVIVDKRDAAAKAAAMARPGLGQLGHLKHLTEGMHELLYLSDGNFTNLRMGSLNPDLGRYFGADSGVLVLENKGQRVPELKAGDVITTVAGKRVNTPSEVMRALRSGTPGASVNVEILRDKKRQIVALDVPEHGPLLLPMPPEPPEPPTPPAPPAQPAPPTPPTPPPTPRAAPPLPPEPPSPPAPPPPPREAVAIEAQVI